jgi:uncharacterized membrane protein YebE (DUF533 family)
MSFKPSEEEERYFTKRNAEARAELRKTLEAAAEHAAQARQISETLHTDKSDVVARIQAMGFDADKSRVFDLLPLIHVAWADGSVQSGERKAIVNILKTRGIEPDSEAWLLVEALLEVRPSQAFLDETLSILKEVIGDSGERAQSIVELSVQVAQAHGALFGLLGTVSGEEKTMLEHIAKQLGGAAADAFNQRLSE